jgi:uncharacterized protein (UPF0335 family)
MTIIAADELRLLIERVERIEEKKKGLGEDVSAVYAEAKARGYDTKIMRQCVKLRAMETHTRQEQDALLACYRDALGMPFADTPLGRFADRLKDLDDKGIGVSVGPPGGPQTPLNETARAKEAVQ